MKIANHLFHETEGGRLSGNSDVANGSFRRRHSQRSEVKIVSLQRSLPLYTLVENEYQLAKRKRGLVLNKSKERKGFRDSS